METSVMSRWREARSRGIAECARSEIAIARAKELCTVATSLCLASRPSTHFSRLRAEIGGTPVRALVRRDGSTFAEQSWLERAGRQAHTPDPLTVTFALSRSCDLLNEIELLDVGRQRGGLLRGATAHAGEAGQTPAREERDGRAFLWRIPVESGPMSCRIFHEGDVDVLQVSGELDVAARRSLDETLRAVTARKVRLDISGLSFIDAKGFSLLQEIKARLTRTGHSCTVCGVGESAPWVQRALLLISSMSTPVDSSLMPSASSQGCRSSGHRIPVPDRVHIAEH